MMHRYQNISTYDPIRRSKCIVKLGREMPARKPVCKADIRKRRVEIHRRACSGELPLPEVDLSRFSAAPSARLSHFPFESDEVFPAQC
jgi:hypothetical protein